MGVVVVAGGWDAEGQEEMLLKIKGSGDVKVVSPSHQTPAARVTGGNGEQIRPPDLFIN